MHRKCYLVGVLMLLAAAPAALGQDAETDSILTSAKPSGGQIATLKSVVRQRVERLVDTGTNPNLREKAHDALVRPVGVKGATPAGLTAYASICADELEDVVGGEDFDIALEAMLILLDINHPRTAGTFATALAAKQPAIRLIAARGIITLQARLKDDAAACQTVLRALGEAGAEEQDQHVLRAIYRAIDFASGVRDFKHADDSAEALCRVFEARVRRLAAGSRDETRDEAGLRAAAGCYEKASNANKARLMANLLALLQFSVQRYLDGETAAEYLRTLARLIDRTEGIIHQLMKASGATPPTNKLATKLKGKTPSQKTREDARAAIDELAKSLRASPWNIQ